MIFNSLRQRVSGGTSRVTMVPAAIMLRAPIRTPARMVTPQLIHASSSISIGAQVTPGSSADNLGCPDVMILRKCSCRCTASLEWQELSRIFTPWEISTRSPMVIDAIDQTSVRAPT
jgi:hypothetical protein